MENTFDTFTENWGEWKSPIIQYAQAYSNIPKHLQQVLQHLVPDDTDDTSHIVYNYDCYHC